MCASNETHMSLYFLIDFAGQIGVPAPKRVLEVIATGLVPILVKVLIMKCKSVVQLAPGQNGSLGQVARRPALEEKDSECDFTAARTNKIRKQKIVEKSVNTMAKN